jgi:D-alanyl-D-alanine carboxypeptidase
MIALLALTFTLSATSPQQALQGILQTYLQKRGAAEHITAASVSVYRGNGLPFIVAAAGTTPSNLYQIGSNTKAFTATLALQLEAEHKLNLDAPIGRWLPQYPAWRNLTIRKMLDMTSGLETYDNTQSFQRAYAARPYRHWTAPQLVSYVYPRGSDPKFLKGWNYSNTGYILTQMILERVTGQSYADLLRTRIFQPLGLLNTYYYPAIIPPAVYARVVPGYFANNEPDNAGLQPLYGKNVKPFSISWTQAAGGIIATPSDVSRSAYEIYAGTLLPPKQRTELHAMVSTKTGKPIPELTPSDPRGFGLGVAKGLMPGLGRIWFYEGMTLGYRVLHAQMPQSGAIVTVALNSQPDPGQDKIGQLLTSVVKALKLK